MERESHQYVTFFIWWKNPGTFWNTYRPVLQDGNLPLYVVLKCLNI